MSELAILPIVLPFTAAALALALGAQRPRATHTLALLTLAALVALALTLVHAAAAAPAQSYRVGDWPAPYGIVLVVDRLSALLLLLTALLSLTVLAATRREHRDAGRHFHVFWLLLVTGLNGAFLAGDLFNLFVFFEILLLASYALLCHGATRASLRAGLAYVVLNLAGSTLFLVALGLLYGTLGTLTLADIALVLPTIPDSTRPLVRAAFALLLVVFVLKAAVFPLAFWLPHTYAAARAPVAALFAIMTKVGVYAIVRVASVALVATDYTATLLAGWLTPLALLTVVLGTVGALAAQRLTDVIAHAVLVSSGTLLAAVAVGGNAAHAAALFYLIHSTVVTAGLFLLAERIAAGRGALGDALDKGPPPWHGGRLACAYLVLAVALSGMPPLSGFLGKLLLLEVFRGHALASLHWAVLLLSGFIIALVLARAASALFWEGGKFADGAVPPAREPAARIPPLPLFALLMASPLLTVCAPQVAGYAQHTAAQLASRTDYIEAVLGTAPRVRREVRP